MKNTLKYFSWLFFIVIAGYFVWFSFDSIEWSSLSQIHTLPVMGTILIAALLYAAIIPVSGLAWSLLLRTHQMTCSPVILASIMGATQGAKYIPGNFAQHVGRAALSYKQGIGLKAFTSSVIQETLLAVGASIFLGTILLYSIPGGIERLSQTYQNALLISCLVFSGFLVFLSMGRLKLPQLLYRNAQIASALQLIDRQPGFYISFSAFSLYCVNYLMIGFGIWLISRSLGIYHDNGYALYTASFSLAWVLGFLTPGAPAGLGIREGVMTLIMANTTSPELLLALILSVRAATILGDILCSAAGMAGLHLFRQTKEIIR